MQIKVENGPTFPVDDRFHPLNGFDAEGQPRPLTIEEGGGLKVSVAGSGDASLASIDTKTPAPGPATMAKSSPVTIASDQVLTVGGVSVRRQFNFIRPANTQAYSAHDAVNTTSPTLITFSDVARVGGGSGVIISAGLFIQGAGAVGSTFRLHFYITEPGSDITPDNDPLVIAVEEIQYYVGYVDLVMQAEGAGICAFQTARVDHYPFQCISNGRNLYCQIEALSAFTPMSAGGVRVFLGAIVD